MPRRTDAMAGPAVAGSRQLIDRPIGLLALAFLLALPAPPCPAQAAADPEVRPAVLTAPAIRRPPSPADTGSRSRATSGWPGTLGMVALTLAAVGAAAWLAGRGRPGRPIFARDRGDSGIAVRLLSRTPLTPRHAIHVVQAGERLLLIGTGTSGAPTLLAELPTAPAPAAPVADPPAAPRIVIRREGGA